RTLAARLQHAGARRALGVAGRGLPGLPPRDSLLEPVRASRDDALAALRRSRRSARGARTAAATPTRPGRRAPGHAGGRAPRCSRLLPHGWAGHRVPLALRHATVLRALALHSRGAPRGPHAQRPGPLGPRLRSGALPPRLGLRLLAAGARAAER